MVTMFEKYAVDCETELKTVEWGGVADTAADVKRATFSLFIIASDKKALKQTTSERETTIASIIHEWIQEHLEEEK